MGLLSKLKSVFGLGQTDHRDAAGETRVTVEREPSAPDATSERAVKEANAETASPAESTTESVSEPEPESEAAAETEAAAKGESVERIKGIGPTYAERLGAVGIDTVEQLADADPADLAAETDLSEGRLGKWIERANAR